MFAPKSAVGQYLLYMKVIEHIQKAKDTLVSFEILPPLKGRTINSIYEHLDPLMAFKPAFINVTYHRSEHVFKKKADGTFDKVEVRKRPGTTGSLETSLERLAALNDESVQFNSLSQQSGYS